jgi:AhpD family alkylhydroperoxidase
MARLPYADPNTPAARGVAERIVAERGSVLHLYQMLLHSPPLTEGWLAFLTAVRHRCSLSGHIRELIIMRVAVVNRAPYEADQHAPIALREGVMQVQIDALPHWETSDRFNEMERAVLALTDTMTRDVQVPAECLDAVRRHFDDTGVVEVVATIAAYNMVSRFIEALGIHSQDDRAH